MDIGPDKTWWKQSVIYHICPLSFYDSDGDGWGDLRGIINKLDYLSWLGVDGIWLSPVYTSPFLDFGYDISDFTAIDPRLGTMEDFLELLSEAHNRGIRVILDLVMNHTSDQHPWFIESSTSPDSPKRNWYIWHPGNNGKVPNNWQSAAGGTAWKLDKTTGQYYYHSFFDFQPDLNWRNKEMQKAYFSQVKFWLDAGVDGFRLDVINMVIKDKKFRNSPLFSGLPFFGSGLYTRNRPKSYRLVRKLRKIMDSYDDRMLVGEIYVLPPGSPSISASYVGEKDDLLHLAFDFSVFFRRWSAKLYMRWISSWYWCLNGKGWPSIVFSNHDLNRFINRSHFTFHKESKARVIAVLLMTLKGTPFIYYGDEIGMKNARLGRKSLVDPYAKKYWPFYQGRDRSRTPMQWDQSRNAGFSEGKPWLPVSTDFKSINVASEMNDQNSLLSTYRKLIELRKTCEALQIGDWIPCYTRGKNVMAYIRKYNTIRILILLNFSSGKLKPGLSGNPEARVMFSTHRAVSQIIALSSIVLFPFEAAIFELQSA